MRHFTLPIILSAQLVTVFVPCVAGAETCIPNVSNRPLWVGEIPTGYEFDYFVGQAEDEGSPIHAKEAAIKNAISSIVARGVISVETISSAKQTEKSVDDQTTFISEVTEEVRVKGHSEKVQGLEQVETHLEQCGNVHRAFSLVRIPKKQPLPAPSGFEPVWRSIVAPSWGQFYKDQTSKGVAILVGELLMIPTAIITWRLSTDASNDAATATQQATRNEYLDRRDRFYQASLLTGGIATALYIYNVIDAIASPQENVYAAANASAPGPVVVVTPSLNGWTGGLSFSW